MQEAVKQASKEGILVFAIGFGSEQEIENNRNVYREMYQHGLILTTPNKIQKSLVRVLRQEIK